MLFEVNSEFQHSHPVLIEDFQTNAAAADVVELFKASEWKAIRCACEVLDLFY